MSFPPAEIQVEVATVRRILEVDCAPLADEEISFVGEGWDNFIFRVGDRHAVRLPRRVAAVGLIVNEQRWLPVLAPRLPLETPVPIHFGKPNRLFPWPWSIVNWISGQTAENHRLTPGDVTVLTKTLIALHQPASVTAPQSQFRGVSVRTKTDLVQRRLKDLERRDNVDASRLAAVWREACQATETNQRVWLHGDLHARNILVSESRLTGLIDWGDLNGGDAANDLACAWTLVMDAPLRQEFLRVYGADEELVRRAKGWAIHIGLAMANSDEPRHVPMGLAILDRVLADA